MILPPEWATSAEIEEHGAFFLCAFVSRAHFDHFAATGETRLPQSARNAARRAERRKANPMYAAREDLSAVAKNRRIAFKVAERKLANAAKWQQQWKIPTLAADVEKKSAALQEAEVTLALFDELSTERGASLSRAGSAVSEAER